MRTFLPSRTSWPSTTCGPIATGSLHVTPRPITAVGWMPGIQAASGYSTGKSARRASCGWATTTRVRGPGASANSAVQRTTPARLWARASLDLAVALLRSLLRLCLALGGTLLLLLQVPLLRLVGSRGERNGLLIERRHGRVELLLQALQLVAEALYFLRERGLRRGVTRRRLQDLLRADVGHLEAARLAGGGLCGRSRARANGRRVLRQHRSRGQGQAHEER